MADATGFTVRVELEGVLDHASWRSVFDGLAVQPRADGTTTVSGAVADQAALHGLVETIRDLGLVPRHLHAVAVRRPANDKETT